MRARVAPPEGTSAPQAAPQQRRAESDVLALQRAAGNRAVGRLLRRRILARRTSAEAMDLARGAAKTYNLWAREHYLKARLTDLTEAQRADQCIQLRAVEKLELATREKQWAMPVLEPDVEERIKARNKAVGLIAWKGSAKEGLEVATEQAKTPIDYVQIALLRQDLDALKQEFRSAAYDNAYKVLDESANRIGDMLRSYGLMVAHAESLVRNVTFGYESSGKAVAEWLSYAKSLDPWKTKKTAAHRSDLTRAAAHVRELRKDYERELAAYLEKYESKDLVSQIGKYWLSLPAQLRVTKPTTDAQRKDLERVKAKHAKAAGAQIEGERDHPLLAAYRERKLDDLASTKGDDSVEEVVDTAIDTLSNILMAKLALKQHKVSALELGPIVGLTRAQLLIRQGTYWDAAITDLIHEETDGNKFAKAVLQVILAALAILPGGQVFALLGLALDLYTAGSELVQYGLDKTFAGTDLDRAKALSDKSPSLAGFAFALISAGLNAAAVRSAFKEADALRGKIAGGDTDAIDALNKLGSEHGVEHLGEDVAKRVHSEPKVEPEAGKTTVSAGETPDAAKGAAKGRSSGKGGKPASKTDPEGAGKGVKQRKSSSKTDPADAGKGAGKHPPKRSTAAPPAPSTAAPRSLAQLARDAGVADEIEGEIEVFAYGTTRDAATNIVDNAQFAAKGGNFGGRMFAAGNVDTARVFAARRVTQVAGSEPGVVGFALPKSTANLLKQRRLLRLERMTDPPPELVNSPNQWVLEPGAAEFINRDGFFFLIE
jgi:hypothetical protein